MYHSSVSCTQEAEYQVLSDVPGATHDLGNGYGITAETRQQWAVTLSNAEVPEEVLQASLVYIQDLASGLMHFEDLRVFGATQVSKQIHKCVRPGCCNLKSKKRKTLRCSGVTEAWGCSDSHMLG